jgi:hypothetical protein
MNVLKNARRIFSSAGSSSSSGVGYTSYVGLVSQSSTNAPTIVELENTTGLTFSTSYISPGTYDIIPSTPLVDNKTFRSMGQMDNTLNVIWFDSGNLKIQSLNNTGTPLNGFFDKTPFEIRIYP